MKSYIKIIAALLVTIVIVIGIVVRNAFHDKTKREFILVKSDKYGICFLVETNIKMILKPDGFKYYGGKNRGHFRLLSKPLDIDKNQVTINGFKATYAKGVNKRVFQFEIDKNLILEDTFVYAQKSPLNLVPYREECEALKEKFEHHLDILGD